MFACFQRSEVIPFLSIKFKICSLNVTLKYLYRFMKNYDYVVFQNFSQDSDRDRDYVPSKNSDVSIDESEIIQEIPDIGRFKKKSPKKSASEVGVVQKNSDNNQEENNDSVSLEENGIGSKVINQVKYRYQKRIIVITDIMTNATTVYFVKVPLQNCKNI